MPDNMTPEVQISPSVQALGRLEFKSNLPDIRLQATKPGEAGQPSLDDFIKFQQEQSAAREKCLQKGKYGTFDSCYTWRD